MFCEFALPALEPFSELLFALGRLCALGLTAVDTLGQLALALGPLGQFALSVLIAACMLCEFSLSFLELSSELLLACGGLCELCERALAARGQLSKLLLAPFGERRELALPLSQRVLRRRELCPLLLELREERGFTGVLRRLGRRGELEDLGLRLGAHVGLGIGIGYELDDALPIALVTPLDLGAEAGAETLFGRQLDPVLGRERARELGAGDEAELDDRLAEALPGLLLLRQRLLEFVACEQALLDEQSPEWPPGDVGRFHRLPIGSVAESDKKRPVKCL